MHDSWNRLPEFKGKGPGSGVPTDWALPQILIPPSKYQADAGAAVSKAPDDK